jgi:hypothetical protein
MIEIHYLDVLLPPCFLYMFRISSGMSRQATKLWLGFTLFLVS